jgi:hypothetical protein
MEPPFIISVKLPTRASRRYQQGACRLGRGVACRCRGGDAVAPAAGRLSRPWPPRVRIGGRRSCGWPSSPWRWAR